MPARSPRLPLLAAFAAGRPGVPEEYAEQLLTLGLFRAEDLHVPVAALSAGQQRRLQIAVLVTRPADLLVHDEPTNHIALDLIEDLESALAAYRARWSRSPTTAASASGSPGNGWSCATAADTEPPPTPGTYRLLCHVRI